MVFELADGVLPRAERATVSQRSEKPFAKQPASHCGAGSINHRKQRGGSAAGFFLSLCQRTYQLKVPYRGAIQMHRLCAPATMEASDMVWRCGRLSFSKIVPDCPCCSQSSREL